MSPQIFIQAGIALLQLAFFAGGVYVIVKQTRKDLNGLGRKVNTIDEKASDRYLAIVLAILLSAPEKKRHEIAALLLSAGLRR